MSTIWTLLLALALLGGSGEACDCKMHFGGSNLAKGRPAFQSSSFSHLLGAADKAVDGNCNGDWYRASCTHTNQDMEPWWYVDLGSNYAISKVVVKNREECCSERLKGAEVRVGFFKEKLVKQNRFCGTVTISSRAISIVSCHGLKGRFVSVHIPGRREYLTLCEVEVYGTKLEDQC